MDAAEQTRRISTPLWVIAAATWVIAIMAIVGAVKAYQVQESLREEIDKLPKIPKIRL